MKLSIWSAFYYELSPEEAVLRFLENGIESAELSDEHAIALLNRSDNVVRTGTKFAAFLKKHNFEISQGHLCVKAEICADDTAMEALFRWIDLYEAIGIRNMVLHCDDLLNTTLTGQEKIDLNTEKLRILAKYIENKPITICLENLGYYPQPELGWIDIYAEDLLSLIDRIGSSQFGICLDTGHLNLNDQSQRDFILKAGKKLRALHIADNNGLADQHLMPYNKGKINFEEVIQALDEVGYEGVFNLEIPGEARIPLKLRDAKIFYIKACYDYLIEKRMTNDL